VAVHLTQFVAQAVALLPDRVRQTENETAKIQM
jgi:hypothetical protein